VDLKVDGGIPEAHILLRQVAPQVLVDPHPHTLGPGDDAVGSGHAVDEMNILRQEVEQGQVVLHHHHRPIASQFLQDAGHIDALVDVEVWAYLVKEIEAGIACCRSGYGHPLQLTSGEAGYLPLQEPLQG